MRVIIEDSAVPSPSRRRIWFKRIILVLLCSILITVLGLFAWLQVPIGEALPEAQEALISDDRVTVLKRDWIAFIPNDAPPIAGIVLYPKERVPPEAYAPLARRIAERGYLATIVYPRLSLPLLRPNAAATIIENYSAIETWFVGGHGLGGMVAAHFAEKHPQQISGVILLAAQPQGDDLLDTNHPILVFYGDENEEELATQRARLPRSAQYVIIEGGSHAQFGYYEVKQNGTLITHQEQLQQTSDAIIALLEEISTP